MTNDIEDESENEVISTQVELDGNIESEELDDDDMFASDSEEDTEDTDGSFTEDDVIIVMDRLNINSTNIQTYILEYDNLPDSIKERVQKAVYELEEAYQEIEEYL